MTGNKVLRVNLDGAFHTIRRATPGMMKARFGRIVNMGSVVGLTGCAGQVNYAAAKAGLVGLTRSVARELASRNVTCNVVAPGPIATAMTDALSDERVAAITEAVPARPHGHRPTRLLPPWPFCAATARPTSPARSSPSTAASASATDANQRH